MHYVNVDSLDEAVAQVQQLGGAVLRPKTAVPKTAWYAVLADPEGNIFAVWQADSTAFPAPEPEMTVRSDGLRQVISREANNIEETRLTNVNSK